MAGIKAEVKKVERLNVPLLIIGLGGTGVQALKEIKKALKERFVTDEHGNLPYVEFWAIDADEREVQGLHHTEYTNISMSLTGVVKAQSYSPEERLWIDPDVIVDLPVGSGAGTVRQISRFFLFRKFTEIREKLTSKLVAMNTVLNDGDALASPEVYIVHSVSGGTGSGIFLDLAMLIRYSIVNANVTDFLVMPDVSERISAPTGGLMVNIIRSNAYAALKELDFWMRANEHKTEYSVRYNDGTSVPWCKPFDRVVLLCSKKRRETMPNIGKLIYSAIVENLSSYYSSENIVDNTFSYKSFEANITALYTTFNPKYPLNYKYASISAATMELPITQMLKEQTKNVLMFIIQSMDESGHVILDDTKLYDKSQLMELMVKNHKGNPTVLGGTFENIYLSSPRVEVPPALSNKGRGDHTKEYGNVLVSPRFTRDTINEWTDSCRNMAARSSLTWINSVKSAFENLCKSIMIDENHGPFALEYYFEGKGDGTATLMSILKKEYENYGGMIVTSNQQINSAISMRDNLITQFNNAGLLTGATGNARVVEELKESWISYCKAVQVHNFASKMQERLGNYIKELETFFEEQYKPLCNALRTIYINAIEAKADKDKDIVSVNDKIKNKLKKDFIISKDLLIQSFIKELSNGVFAFDELHNTYKWTSKSMDEHINEELNKVFKDALGTFDIYNVDKLLEETYDTDEEREKQIGVVQKQLQNASTPLFAEDMTRALPSTLITYNYISLPKNATKFNERIMKRIHGKFEPKYSDVLDSATMIQSYDGIYLNNFDGMQNCKNAYEQRSNCHLVSKSRLTNNFFENWEVLPSLLPSYLFAAEPVKKEAILYNDTLAFVNEALETGMLEIDWGKDKNDKPNEIVLTFYLRKSNGLLEQNEEVLRGLRAIFENNATSTDSKLEEVQNYLFNEENKASIIEKDFTDAFVTGTNDVPNPWATGLNAGMKEKLLEERFEYLKKYIAHILLSRPVLNQQLQSQIEAFRYAKVNTGNMQGEAEKWTAYVNFARDFYALILSGKLIKLMDGSYAFVDLNGKRQAFEISDSIERDLPPIVRVLMQLHDNKHVTPATFLIPEIEKFKDKLLYERFTREEMKEAVELYQTKYEDSLNKTIRALTYIDIAPTSRLQDPNLRKNVLSILERLKESIENIVNGFVEATQ